jgi:hypothetical protein
VASPYLLHRAETLLRLARSINNPQAASALVEKAPISNRRLMIQGPTPDVNPRAPDVQRPASLLRR